MKIAQVAPLFESVPPATYGGTERVVSYLTEELVRQGHQVTLFASGDSRTTAELVACSPRALREHHHPDDWQPYTCAAIAQVCERASEFDLIHFHTDFGHLLSRHSGKRITTVHGTLDRTAARDCYRLFPREPLISISHAQRHATPELNWLRTVHHGLPRDSFRPSTEPGRYLLFVGRMAPEKGAHRAIAMARAAGIPIKLAAKIGSQYAAHFHTVIEPMLDPPWVEYLGEVGGPDKEALLAGALALLFPIEWAEPFGLVLIEAMACGTPVIAYPRGAVPEIISDGDNGFVVRSVEEGVRAIGRLDQISRERCRTIFEERFTAERMARDYLAIYQRMAQPLRAIYGQA